MLAVSAQRREEARELDEKENKRTGTEEQVHAHTHKQARRICKHLLRE